MQTQKEIKAARTKNFIAAERLYLATADYDSPEGQTVIEQRKKRLDEMEAAINPPVAKCAQCRIEQPKSEMWDWEYRLFCTHECALTYFSVRQNIAENLVAVSKSRKDPYVLWVGFENDARKYARTVKLIQKYAPNPNSEQSSHVRDCGL